MICISDENEVDIYISECIQTVGGTTYASQPKFVCVNIAVSIVDEIVPA